MFIILLALCIMQGNVLAILFFLNLFYVYIQAISADSQLIELTAQYLNETALKHILTSKFQSFSQINLDHKLSQIQINFSQISQPQLQTPLTLSSYEWQIKNLKILTIYSNNPLNYDVTSDLQNLTTISKYPFEGIKIQLNIDQSLLQELFPQRKIVGDTLVQFDLDNPSFYASYFKQSSYHIWYFIGFGYGTTVFLIINYFLRSFFTNVSEEQDHGQMIAHYLALVSPAFVVYPIKAEILSFSYGFMGLNFPWMNDFFAPMLTNPADNSPSLMKIFYVNLSIASTYLIPLGVILLLAVIGLILIQVCQQSDQQKQLNKSILFNFLYNIFSYGLISASVWAIAGSFMNSLDYIFSFDHIMNSSFYIAGWLMLILIILDIFHSLCKYASRHFYKLRNLIKIAFIALSNLSPVYFYGVMMAMNVFFVAGEFFISKKQNSKAFSIIWVFKNILLDTALMLLVFCENKYFSVLVCMGLVGIALFTEIYEHWQIRSLNATKLKKVKEDYHKAAINTVQTDQNETKRPKVENNIWEIDAELEQQPSKAKKNPTQHTLFPHEIINLPITLNNVAQNIEFLPQQTDAKHDKKPSEKMSRRKTYRNHSSTPIIVASINSHHTKKDESKQIILNNKNRQRLNQKEDNIERISDF